MENGDRGAELVRGIGHELPQLTYCGVDALEKVIKRFCKAAELVVRRGDRERAPESLAVRYAIGHEGSVLRKRGDGCQASTHVQGRNQRGSHEANQEKE